METRPSLPRLELLWDRKEVRVFDVRHFERRANISRLYRRVALVIETSLCCQSIYMYVPCPEQHFGVSTAFLGGGRTSKTWAEV